MCCVRWMQFGTALMWCHTCVKSHPPFVSCVITNRFSQSNSRKSGGRNYLLYYQQCQFSVCFHQSRTQTHRSSPSDTPVTTTQRLPWRCQLPEVRNTFDSVQKYLSTAKKIGANQAVQVSSKRAGFGWSCGYQVFFVEWKCGLWRHFKIVPQEVCLLGFCSEFLLWSLERLDGGSSIYFQISWLTVT